jgi:pteridine reductase
MPGYGPSPFRRICSTKRRRVRCPFLIAQAAAPLLRRSKGCLVNVLDVAAERPWVGYAHYCAAKAALRMLTLGLAKELAPEVRVNAVAPGAVLFPVAEPEPQRAERIARIPLKREGRPGDVAEAVLYLWRSAYVTGEIAAVDGGARL